MKKTISFICIFAIICFSLGIMTYFVSAEKIIDPELCYKVKFQQYDLAGTGVFFDGYIPAPLLNGSEPSTDNYVILEYDYTYGGFRLYAFTDLPDHVEINGGQLSLSFEAPFVYYSSEYNALGHYWYSFASHDGAKVFNFTLGTSDMIWSNASFVTDLESPYIYDLETVYHTFPTAYSGYYVQNGEIVEQELPLFSVDGGLSDVTEGYSGVIVYGQQPQLFFSASSPTSVTFNTENGTDYINVRFAEEASFSIYVLVGGAWQLYGMDVREGASFALIPNTRIALFNMEGTQIGQSDYLIPFETNADNETPVVIIDDIEVTAVTSPPYYPGFSYEFTAFATGIGIVPGTVESSLYVTTYGANSPDTYADYDYTTGEIILHIANDETATNIDLDLVSTYDANVGLSYTVPISYPLQGVEIIPKEGQYLTESGKQRQIQFSLLLPNGQPFDYEFISWVVQGDTQHFSIDSNGLLTIAANAPAASSCTVRFYYTGNSSALSPAGVSVNIVSSQEGIYDQLTPTPEQSDKADQMEDAIGDAADKLENNNSSLGQLTPTRPQINTDLQLDPDKLIAVSPLVTNIWSISGLQSLIGIVVLVATVAYIFFGKRDG